MNGVVIDTRGRPQGVQRLWPMVVLRGGLMIVLGILVLVWPALTAVTLVVLFGAVLIVDGLSSLLFGATRRRRAGRGGGWFFQGGLALIVGLLAVIWPTAVASLALILVGVWMLLASTVLLAFGLTLRRVRSRYWGWPVGLAAAGIVLSLVLLVNPMAGVVGLATLLGIVLTVAGVALVSGGLRLRSYV